MLFRQIFDPSLAQNAYLIGCQRTGEALVIDPERDVERYAEAARREGLRVVAVVETHIHADFLSGCREFATRFGVTVYLSDEGDAEWKYAWAEEPGLDVRLLHDGDTFSVGRIEIRALHTPGHTPEHLSFLVTDRGGAAEDPMGIASGDFVFVGDLGRPDLLESAAGEVGAMEPAAHTLFHSLPRFLELPDYLQVWPGHGAGSACGKALGAVPVSTVGYEKRHNAALLVAGHGEDAFVREILSGQPEPPLYFASMKRLNKEGPPLLREREALRRLGPEELAGLAWSRETAVLDLRPARQAFMAGHLPGSLFCPLDKSFLATAGSYVEEGAQMVLLVEEEDLAEAARQLSLIGLDAVTGWAPPEMLERAGEVLGGLAATETVDFPKVREMLEEEDPRLLVLDVRRRAEHEARSVPGASNIAHTRLVARSGELPAGRRLAVHCAHGTRAAVASALLERLGHEVLYVDDSFESWQALTPAAEAGLVEDPERIVEGLHAELDAMRAHAGATGRNG